MQVYHYDDVLLHDIRHMYQRQTDEQRSKFAASEWAEVRAIYAA